MWPFRRRVKLKSEYYWIVETIFHRLSIVRDAVNPKGYGSNHLVHATIDGPFGVRADVIQSLRVWSANLGIPIGQGPTTIHAIGAFHSFSTWGITNEDYWFDQNGNRREDISRKVC
jgi:hypothetical protein